MPSLPLVVPGDLFAFPYFAGKIPGPVARLMAQSLRSELSPSHFVTAPWGHAVTSVGRSGRPFGILRAKYQDQPRIQVVKYPEPEDIPSEKHLSVRESRSFPGWNAQFGRSVRRNGGFPGRKSQFAMTCPGKQTFPRMTMGLGTPEQAMACQLLKSSCVSYPKGLAPPALCR